MRIAMLGASSQIAQDLIRSFSAHDDHELTLVARRPDAVAQWIETTRDARACAITDFAGFDGSERFDAVINFVGIANPAATVALGAEILDVTLQADLLAMRHLARHPDCRYLFLSSGAAYCSTFEAPADEDTRSTIALNHLQPQHWYGLAKLHAECRHRACSHLSIVDLRVFSYFSRTQDMAARFLVTDALRAIRQATVLQASAEQNFRDYLHPSDFHALVNGVLAHPPANTALDCYTLAPVDKWTLLAMLQEKFGLRYEIAGAGTAVNATGGKPRYYSLDRRAAAFGYTPAYSSLDCIAGEAQAWLSTFHEAPRDSR